MLQKITNFVNELGSLLFIMEAVFTWILENWPLLGVGILIFFAAWHLAKLYFKRFVPTEAKVNKLPCSGNTASIQELKSMRCTVDAINEQVSEISQWIMKKDSKMIAPLAKKHSPLQMVKAGRDLFEMCGAKKAIDENQDFLIQEMEKRKPATPYDVEETASTVLFTNLSHELFNVIKNYIYYAPSEITLKDENDKDVKVTLSLYAIVMLMAIELRDRYLAIHPEVPQEQEIV